MILPLPRPGARSGLSVRIGTRHFGPLFDVPFDLSGADLTNHLHVMGKSGMGKSKFLCNFALECITQGRGVSLIDPHGDLANDLLLQLLDRGFFRSDDALQKVWYVDLASTAGYVPFNVLRVPYSIPETARHVTAALMRVWPSLGDGAAPRFENIVLAGSAVLAANHLPITLLHDLLVRQDFREALLTRVADEHVVSFWHDRFDEWATKDKPLMMESTLTRLFLLTFTPALRHSLGQTENLLDFRAIMDQGTSVIYNLAGLDEQTQRIFGCLISVGYEEAALAREDVREGERRPHVLIIDEFSQFSAQNEESLSRVLSLCRKYQLSLVLAHQTFSQLSARLAGALQNALPVFFGLGFDDARWAAPRLLAVDPYAVKHEVKPVGLAELPVDYHPAYLSLTEQDRLMAKQLEELGRGRCFIKVTRGISRPQTTTYQIRTMPMPVPTSSWEQLVALKETYARLLLRPAMSVSEPAVAVDARTVMPISAPSAGTISVAATAAPIGPRRMVPRIRLGTMKVQPMVSRLTRGVSHNATVLYRAVKQTSTVGQVLRPRIAS